MSHQNTRQTSAQPDDALFEKAAHWLMRNQSEGQTKEEQEAFQQWLDEEITHAIAYAEAEALWDESTQALQSKKPENLHQSGDPKRNEVVAFLTCPHVVIQPLS
ncbi:FecR/PupR family sigma factor regulator [Kiloniella sp. b19]|uniref:FecR/PupR family sigma factor regulator n=1 Tax=Kiloniella sp. GXU_MW_B19 TaxID=3141326 RepID=UPI0031D20D41